MANSSQRRTGRAVTDERGNSVWEFCTEEGDYSRDVATGEVRSLDEGLALEAPPPLAVPSPEKTGVPYLDLQIEDRPRRTLDDMRKLSEEIEAACKAIESQNRATRRR